ncbi:MAG: amidohydrolase family protein [Planctomycetes bacterium]|nr:amidohydrolase family protein [Planctomycetota bacterium]
MKTLLLALLILLQAKAEVIVLKGGRIVPVTGPEIENGMILLSGGKIRRIGAAIDVPAGATVVELPKGSWILPGFVDAHSHLGSAFDVEESTESLTPEARAVEAFTSRHPDVRAALGSGVTTVALAPGSGNLVGGRVGIVKLNGGRYDRALLRIAAGTKISLGAEALRPDREPTSRTGAISMLREQLRDPQGDLRKSPVFVHASTAGEIESALELQAAFQLKMTLVHARQAGDVIERLAAAKVRVGFGPLTVNDRRETLETPGRLAKAGVAVAFVSDAPSTPEEHLRVTAAFAVKYGMNRDAALRALTTVPAEILGLSQDFGSLEEGKAADLAVWSGDPLSLTSGVELVIVDGKVTWRKGEKP